MRQEESWLLKEKYGGLESKAFQADIERLKAGEPLAYLIGHIPFLDCEIDLDSRPLIPRAETEYWVEKAISTIKDHISSSQTRRNVRVLDLCAGSGCIGVAVAKNVPDTRVTFAEIDPTHLPTIEKNLQGNLPDYSNRMEYFSVVESDLFKNVEDNFDFILTNPPYIDPTLDRTEDSVKGHEPHLALYGGKNGFAIINAILASASTYLREGGQLWIEHEPEQVGTLHSLAKQNNFSVVTNKDQYDVERYSVLILGKIK